ncbi:hypothetical protein AMJ44_14685 [candidate division WOR-1 bacterium DG_54_3]|jgi:heavy metal sensor kinase|uniref:histidine kinase n=1 Tax=candidate division WOR-1 bacterium DG_54_3 TaxID=1703775 RepID=A0A0S7XL69_UNCSA|nr:MAG: hypothetical protein AMJ44_14685 [candidate division WOR-1 bacterium DG_54_3]
MKINSIRFKIRVLFIGILGIILVIYSTYLYFSLYFTLYDEIDDELYSKAEEIAKAIDLFTNLNETHSGDFLSKVKKVIILEEFPDPDEINPLQQQWLQKVDKLNLKDDYIDLLTIKGESLVRSNNLKRSLFFLNSTMVMDLKEGVPVYKNLKLNKLSIRAVSFPYFFQESELYIIQVGTSLKPTLHILKNRLIHILASIPIILLLSSLFGKVFVTRLLRPVFDITRTASKITNDNLSARVKNDHADEEMKYLVSAFNDMISRLESSFNAISDFSSQVAHELKTPLTIIKGESDIALRKERAKEEYQKAIKTILEETERMLKVIEGLLMLTKLDFPSKAFNFEQFNLIELLTEIYEQSRLLAVHKGIHVDINVSQEPLFISGDRLHLRRLFLNLIDNSIKYTDRNGNIRIVATKKDQKTVVSISDTGIGIAKEDLSKIFDRFFHIDRTGKNAVPSTGLGLSIAKSIVDIHNGFIEVTSKIGEGSTFTVSLPSI